MMLHYTKTHKHAILLVLCILLLLAPMTGTAESDGLISGETARHTWLENGNQVFFTPDDHQLSVVDKGGTPIVSCNLGQDVEDIASVYADADCLRLLVSAQNGRMIYDIQGNDLEKYTLPEEQICGPVYLTKNGAYYRTTDSTIGYFDLASEQSVILSERQIGGLYSVTSGNETDYLAVSVLPSGEKHILAVQDGSIAWACAMPGTNKDTLIDCMAAVNGDKLLVAYEDMAVASDYQLICYADGKAMCGRMNWISLLTASSWMAPIISGSLAHIRTKSGMRSMTCQASGLREKASSKNAPSTFSCG